MTLDITARKIKGVTVLDLNGELIKGESSEVLCKRIKKLLAEDHKKIHLNMARVNCLDSVGLGALCAASRSAHSQGRILRITSLSKEVREALLLAGPFIKGILVDESADEAIGTFQ